MSSAEQHDTQVHAEVEDAEDLRLAEGEDHNPDELGQRNAAEDLNTQVQTNYLNLI